MPSPAVNQETPLKIHDQNTQGMYNPLVGSPFRQNQG